MTNSTTDCPICGTQLPPRKPGPGRHRIYCSPRCGQQARRAIPFSERPKASPWKPPETHTCETCGGKYAPRKTTQRYCSHTCSSAARRITERIERTCDACGEAFTSTRSTRYCSRDCYALHKIMQRQTCSVDGCEKPNRARGLCSTHYNQRHQLDRHVTIEVPCTVCGTPVTKRKDDISSRRVVCSLACRYVITWGVDKNTKRKTGKELVGPVRFNKPTTPPDNVLPKSGRKYVSTQCRECGAWFIDYANGTHRPTTTCSETCRRRLNRNRPGRSRFRIPTRERQAIYRRDKWTCQLCFQPVDPALPYKDNWAATLDHITPRAHGGPDTPDNLRLAHRYCNGIRSDAQLPDAWFISPHAYRGGGGTEARSG